MIYKIEDVLTIFFDHLFDADYILWVYKENDIYKFHLIKGDTLVDLVGTHKISAEEYWSWHATGKWEGLIFQVEDMSKKYYAYDFKNPRRLATPIKIVKSGRVWTKIDDEVQMSVQERLF